MDIIAALIEPIAPVAADMTVGQLQHLFRQAPDALAVAVVADGGPIGVVLREVALAAAADDRKASVLVTPASLILEAGTAPLEAARRAAEAHDGAGAYLVYDQGQLAGCGVLRGLLGRLCRAEDPIDSTVRAAEAAELSGRRAFKAEFLSMVTRELRGPIDGVLAMTELLDRQPLASDAQAQVKAIREAGDTLLRLLSNAADFARAEQGLLDIAAEPVRLRSVLDEVQARWQDRTSDNGVTLLMSYDGDAELSAMTDPVRLQQIFDSLIEPALTYTRSGSVEVTLKASADADGVHVEGRVRDTGPGLPPEQLARIFETGANGVGGRCIGVALARQVVLALNGCIRAESNVGAGVTMLFDFLCPLAVAETDASSEPGVSGAAHVLVVDDNATNRMVAEALVEMFDCTSECAEDGVEAVEIARSGRFDVILMDIKMPRMDGMAATRAIRALPGPAGSVPIIALTANVDPEDARAYLASGMCCVVEKPIKPDRLLQAINEALAGAAQKQSAAA